MLNCLKHVVRPSSFIYFKHDFVALLFDLSVRLDEVIAGIDKIIDTTHVKKRTIFQLFFIYRTSIQNSPFWDKISLMRQNSMFYLVN